MSKRKTEILVQYDDGSEKTYDSLVCARIEILEFFADGVAPLSVSRRYEDTNEEIEEIGVTWDISFSTI